MVNSCSAYNCTVRFRKGGVPLHKFPLKNKDLLLKWIFAVRRENFIPTTCSYVCGNHFLTEDYAIVEGRRRLKQNVVPSVFDFPSPLKEALQKRREQEKKVEEAAEKQVEEEMEPENHVNRISLANDHTYCLVPGKILNPYQEERYKRAVKSLQQKLRRAEKRLFALEEVTA